MNWATQRLYHIGLLHYRREGLRALQGGSGTQWAFWRKSELLFSREIHQYSMLWSGLLRYGESLWLFITFWSLKEWFLYVLNIFWKCNTVSISGNTIQYGWNLVLRGKLRALAVAAVMTGMLKESRLRSTWSLQRTFSALNLKLYKGTNEVHWSKSSSALLPPTDRVKGPLVPLWT